MLIEAFEQDISRLTYDENGKVVVVFNNDSAAISLPPGFKGLEGVQVLSLGRFLFVQQPDGFPLLIGQYPDLTGVYHLSHNEVIVTTTRFGVEAGYMRYSNGELYHEKLTLPNRHRPSGLALQSERKVVAAYPHDHFVYAQHKSYQAPPRRGEVKVAVMCDQIAVACCDEISLHDENFEIKDRYKWNIDDELVDIKFSSDMLVIHVAYKRCVLRFDLDG